MPPDPTNRDDEESISRFVALQQRSIQGY